MDFQTRVEDAFKMVQKGEIDKETYRTFEEFKKKLNKGTIRAAEKKGKQWIVNGWIKKGILLGFRIGSLIEMSINPQFVFYDKHTYPLKSISIKDGVRIVPGGSSIRDGCYIGKNVICMPPMYVNTGAYIGNETMIDSHVLIGSCAQIGKRVHISAGTQIGGVLEPIGSFPAIIEDDVLIGGNCGIYEGIIIQKRAIIGAGTILTGSIPVYDLVRDEIYKKNEKKPLIIPEGAVVISGTRPIQKGQGKKLGLSIYTPIIIKYRDEKTESAVQIEEWLRQNK